MARARSPRTAGQTISCASTTPSRSSTSAPKALHYAHTRGVIHRDIKPSNIMLTQDSDVRIIDFGIALVQDSDISRIEGIAGSPSYMSPEQVQSFELTNSSDLYSLGAVMYELLTGSRPFRAGNLQKLLHPDRLRDAAADSHVAQGDPGGSRRTSSRRPCRKIPTSVTRAASTSLLSSRAAIRSCGSRIRRIDRQEQFGVLRRLKFFHEFSHAEIWEVLRASQWQDYAPGEEIVKEGEMDDRFYIIVSGQCAGGAPRAQRLGAPRYGRLLRRSQLRAGCEAYRHHSGSQRCHGAEGELDAAGAGVGVVPAAVQLAVFLRTLIGRLQSGEQACDSGARRLTSPGRAIETPKRSTRRW